METNKQVPKLSNFALLKRMLKFVDNPIPFLLENAEKYNGIYSMNLGVLNIVSTNHEFAQHVLQKKNKNYKKSYVQTDTLGQYVGKGLLTANGDYWLRQRRLIQPGFHREKLAALVDIMLDEVDDYILKFEQFAKEKKVFDICPLMTELTFRIVSKSLFSTGISDAEMERLGNDITEIQEFLVKQIRQPYLEYWFRLSGQIKHTLKTSKSARNLIGGIITGRKSSGEEHNDLLDMLIASRYEDTGEGMTDEQLLDESLIIFLAGHETSANAMAWTWYLLSQHPDAVQKIRDEIKEHLGERKPTFADLPKMQYTMQVIQESMRIYPPAWLTDRETIEDDAINGYHIPKGALVLPFIYGIHHSEKYWDKPEEFRPERFTKEAQKQRPAYTYLPFGGGPRLCIGNNFAMMEMQLIVICLIQRFNFKTIEGQNIELLPLVTLRPAEGIKMQVTTINP